MSIVDYDTARDWLNSPDRTKDERDVVVARAALRGLLGLGNSRDILNDLLAMEVMRGLLSVVVSTATALDVDKISFAQIDFRLTGYLSGTSNRLKELLEKGSPATPLEHTLVDSALSIRSALRAAQKSRIEDMAVCIGRAANTLRSSSKSAFTATNQDAALVVALVPNSVFRDLFGTNLERPPI